MSERVKNAEQNYFKNIPGSNLAIGERYWFSKGYEQAERAFIALVKQYLVKGERCMNQSIGDGEGDLYTFWDGFHNCAENILRELKEK